MNMSEFDNGLPSSQQMLHKGIDGLEEIFGNKIAGHFGVQVDESKTRDIPTALIYNGNEKYLPVFFGTIFSQKEDAEKFMHEIVALRQKPTKEYPIYIDWERPSWHPHWFNREEVKLVAKGKLKEIPDGNGYRLFGKKYSLFQFIQHNRYRPDVNIGFEENDYAYTPAPLAPEEGGG